MKRDRKKPRRSSREPLQSRTSILIIDTDPMMANLLRAYLEDEKGFVVYSAETAADGIRLASEQIPDLILMDFWLGEVSGLEVHDNLRQNPATQEIPVVYLSSFLTLRRIEQATVKGARGFITKPFTQSEIYNKVTSVHSFI